jgi:hypothetical protein
MDWHWDKESGRRVPTSRRAYLGSLLGRLPAQVLLVVVALAVWGVGVYELVTDSYWVGGALIFTGGLLLIIWAGGGLRRFFWALAGWLGGPE